MILAEHRISRLADDKLLAWLRHMSGAVPSSCAMLADVLRWLWGDQRPYGER
jgi:hypothetical protein